MEEDEESKLGLSLGLGQCQFAPTHKLPKEHNQRVQCHLSLLPYMKEEVEDEVCNCDYSISRTTVDEDVEDKDNSSSVYCNTINSSSKSNNGVKKKKLVLTEGQLMLLEENFREHSILTPIKKSELAEQLNLQPRKIEVWYQNRRARTKQKQKEMNCEFWKTLCESLRDENRKLKIELQDLRSRKSGTSLYVHLPLTMTPSFDHHKRRKEQSRPQWEEHLDLITPT